MQTAGPTLQTPESALLSLGKKCVSVHHSGLTARTKIELGVDCEGRNWRWKIYNVKGISFFSSIVRVQPTQMHQVFQQIKGKTAKKDEKECWVSQKQRKATIPAAERRAAPPVEALQAQHSLWRKKWPPPLSRRPSRWAGSSRPPWSSRPRCTAARLSQENQTAAACETRRLAQDACVQGPMQGSTDA